MEKGDQCGHLCRSRRIGMPGERACERRLGAVVPPRPGHFDIPERWRPEFPRIAQLIRPLDKAGIAVRHCLEPVIGAAIGYDRPLKGGERRGHALHIDPGRFALGQFVVTAPRSEGIGIDGKSLSAEVIYKFNRTALDDAVNLMPGVVAGNSGGTRNERLVFVRGFDRFQVPLCPPDNYAHPRHDPALIKLIVRAHQAEKAIAALTNSTIEAAATSMAVSIPYFCSLLRVAHLAPDITAAILDGRQPAHLNRQFLARLNNLPDRLARAARDARVRLNPPPAQAEQDAHPMRIFCATHPPTAKSST